MLSKESRADLAWFHKHQGWISLVVAAYLSIIAVNLFTLAVGPIRVYHMLNANQYGVMFSFTTYDSPGTDAGLVGVATIFVLISFFTYITQKKFDTHRVLLFIVVPLFTGAFSLVLWNSCCNDLGRIPFGASGIDFAATACLIIFASVDLFKQLSGSRNVPTMSQEWIDTKMLPAIVYLTVIIALLFYALVTQPIYVPSVKYLSQVHEFSFILAAIIVIFAELCIQRISGTTFKSQKISSRSE